MNNLQQESAVGSCSRFSFSTLFVFFPAEYYHRNAYWHVSRCRKVCWTTAHNGTNEQDSPMFLNVFLSDIPRRTFCIRHNDLLKIQMLQLTSFDSVNNSYDWGTVTDLVGLKRWYKVLHHHNVLFLIQKKSCFVLIKRLLHPIHMQ